MRVLTGAWESPSFRATPRCLLLSPAQVLLWTRCYVPWKVGPHTLSHQWNSCCPKFVPSFRMV